MGIEISALDYSMFGQFYAFLSMAILAISRPLAEIVGHRVRDHC